MGNIHEDDACFHHFRNDWIKVLGSLTIHDSRKRTVGERRIRDFVMITMDITFSSIQIYSTRLDLVAPHYTFSHYITRYLTFRFVLFSFNLQ
jgi:hypothetical protein